jgi:hemoglobin-like flavoprotein
MPGSDSTSKGASYDDAVIASYHRARETGRLFDTFYDIFLNKSPEIPPKFAGTDFDVQKRVLKESLLLLLSLDSRSAAGRQEIERLGVVHSRQGHDIRPELYELWLDSLCEALSRHDPQWAPELDALWRRALRPGIERMSAMY